MKGFLKLFVVAVLTVALLACNKGNATSEGEDNSDFSSMLPGHWANSETDEYTTIESLSFDSLWGNSVVYQYASYPGDDEYEIIVRGTYSLSGSVIIAQYNEMVSVSTYIDGVYGDSYRGFTDGVNKTVHYTIESCDGTNMVLTDETGNRLNMHKYKTL